MDKATEIAILTETADKLGTNSYCGDWMKSVIAEVDYEISNDFLPTPTLNRTRTECQQMVKEAEMKAAQIIEEAKRKADSITKDAMKRREDIKARLHRQVLVVLGEISDI